MANGRSVFSGLWLSDRSGVGIPMGSIRPLLSVRRIAMTVPSSALTVIATSLSGSCALLAKAWTWIYPVALRAIPPFCVQIMICAAKRKSARSTCLRAVKERFPFAECFDFRKPEVFWIMLRFWDRVAHNDARF